MDLLKKIIIWGVVALAAVLTIIASRQRSKHYTQAKPRPNQGGSDGKNELSKKSLSQKSLSQREALLKTLADRMGEAKRLEAYQTYSRLFYELAGPLQYLAGLAAVWREEDAASSEEWATPDVLCRTLEMSVIYEMDAALQKYGAVMDKGKLLLPPPKGGGAPSEGMERSGEWSDEEIIRYTRQYEADIRERQVWAEHKALVEELGSVCGPILAMKGQPSYDACAVRGLAKEAERILEKHGIFLMFYDDSRLRAQPQTRDRFVRVSDAQLKYPALIVRKNGSYEQFGSFAGTCGKG